MGEKLNKIVDNEYVGSESTCESSSDDMFEYLSSHPHGKCHMEDCELHTKRQSVYRCGICTKFTCALCIRASLNNNTIMCPSCLNKFDYELYNYYFN